MLWISLIVAAVAFCSTTSASVSSCIGRCPGMNPNDDVYFLRHEDCSKYCSCDYGTVVEMDCPPNLHYSAKDRVCTSPATAGCPSSKAPAPSTPNPIDNNNSTDNCVPTQSTLTPPPSSPFPVNVGHDCIGQCPLQDNPDTSVVLAHRDCTKFCKCLNGQAYVQGCPANLCFSKDFGGCIYPHVAKCQGLNGYSMRKNSFVDWCPCPTTPTHYPTWTTSQPRPIYTYSPTTVTTPTPTWTPSPRPTFIYPSSTASSPSPDVLGCFGRCPVVDPDKVVHLVHKDCTKFCKCAHGKPYVMACPANLHFNPMLEVCNYPSRAQCTGIGGWGFPERDDNARMNVMGFNKLFRW